MLRIPLGSSATENNKSPPVQLTAFPSANVRGGDLVVQGNAQPVETKTVPVLAQPARKEWVPNDPLYGTVNVLTGGALNDLRANAAKLVAVKNGSMDKFYHARGHCEAAARGAYQAFWARLTGEAREIYQLKDKIAKLEKSTQESLDRAALKFRDNPDQLMAARERIRQEEKRERERAESDMREDNAANERGLREGERIREEEKSSSAEYRERRCREAVSDTLPQGESSNSGETP